MKLIVLVMTLTALVLTGAAAHLASGQLSNTLPLNITNIPANVFNPLGNVSSFNSSETQNSLASFTDKELAKFNTQADSIKAQISSATFTPGNGRVIELINSLSYMKGEISALSAGYSILHSVEDALINKIKTTGPSAFSPGEQS